MERLACLCLHLLVLVFFASNNGLIQGLSCKDENNNDVDWFITYKLPKVVTEDKLSDLYNGKAYAYITSKQNQNWILSDLSVESKKSTLGLTWQEFADNKDSTSYLFYNDDAPGTDGTFAAGHLKGYFAFNEKTGFWLIHSIPNFGEKDKYEYPGSALTNGQIAMCVTFSVEYLNDICTHLLYCNPLIYERQLSKSVSRYLDDSAKTIFSKKPAFIRREPFLRESTLKSLDKQLFYSFAKDNQLKKDLYSDIIAQRMSTNLIAETWKRGAGGNLPPFCHRDYSVVDITAIRMKVSNRREDIRFKSTEDHSKWAISDDAKTSVVCVGDLNRMKSQERRGGGAICFKSKTVWKTFQSIVYETELCPI